MPNGAPQRQNGGRRPGSVTKLTRRRAEELARTGETPLDVMIQNMLFWHRHANSLGDRLAALVIDEDAEPEMQEEQRKAAMPLLREFLACREKAQECAVDAAPYCHPKLQSIAVKPDTSPEEVGAKILEIATDEDAARVYQRVLIGA